MPRKDPALAQEARTYYTEWRDHFKRNIDQYHLFFSFVMGDQWDDDETRLLKTYKKVPLTFNKLGTLINSLLGEQQQNTPQLEVVPDDNCDEQTAQVRTVLIKDISLNSSSNVVYQQAAKQAFIGGYGAFLVDTEYETERSFNQRLILKEIKDPTKAFWCLSAQTPCKTDGLKCGYEVRMSRDRFKSIWGKKVERDIKDVTSDDYVYNFADRDGISILYWYKRVYEPFTLYRLSSGDTLDSEEMKELEVLEGEGEEKVFLYRGEPVRVEEKRRANKYTIKHYVTAGDYVLDESDFPSEQLPMPFVDQNSYYDKQGRQVCRPFVLDAKDAQRYLNYIGTQSAYLLKISRFDQFLVSKNNVKSQDTQQIWRDPGSVNGGLVYDVDVQGGTVPQQLRPPELSQSLLTQYQRAMDDIHTSTGMYPTRMGDQGSEVSGAAIDARTRQGSYATFVAFNSLNRAIAVAGQIINEAIPKVYDSQRVMMLMMPDTGLTPVEINKATDDYGMVIENDLKKGTYQVRLLPGASSEGQKTQARESLDMVLSKQPQIFPIVADLYAESLPMDNNIELRNRLRTLVPPEIIEAGKSGKPLPPKPPQPDPQQMQMQMEMQLQEKQMALKAQELKLKEEEVRMKMEVELQKIQEERLKIAAQLEEQQLRYDAEMHRTRTDEQISHGNNLAHILTHLK